MSDQQGRVTSPKINGLPQFNSASHGDLWREQTPLFTCPGCLGNDDGMHTKRNGCGHAPGRMPYEVVLEVLTDNLPGWDDDYPVSYEALAQQIVDALATAREQSQRETSS